LQKSSASASENVTIYCYLSLNRSVRPIQVRSKALLSSLVLQSCKYQAFPSHLLRNRKRQQSTCRYPPWRGGRWQAQLFPGFGGR